MSAIAVRIACHDVCAFGRGQLGRARLMCLEAERAHRHVAGVALQVVGHPQGAGPEPQDPLIGAGYPDQVVGGERVDVGIAR